MFVATMTLGALLARGEKISRVIVRIQQSAQVKSDRPGRSRCGVSLVHLTFCLHSKNSAVASTSS